MNDSVATQFWTDNKASEKKFGGAEEKKAKVRHCM